MVKTPVFSVIVPVYNVEKYLESCLESLINQTLENMEIICINDGSTDDSLAIMNAYRKRDNRIILINKANEGVSSARNEGLRIARGEYIIFVDADDFVEKNLCEKLHEEILQTNADIIVFEANIFPKRAVEYEQWLLDTLNVNAKTYTDNCTSALFKESCSKPFLWNKCYKKELLKKNNIWFNKDIKLGQDNLFQFLIFPKANTIVFIKDILYNYRCMREDSTMYKMRSNHEWKIEMHIKIMENVFISWSDYGILEKYKNELYTWCIYFVVKEIEKSQLPVTKRYKLLKTVGEKLERYGFVLQKEYIDLLISEEKRMLNSENTMITERTSKKLRENTVTKNLSHDKCTGCGACFNSCLVNAITMQMDEKGFYIPFVNMDQCINCGKCVSNCPVLNPKYENENEPECYAVCASDKIREHSSSGGAFGVFAEKVLNENGIVCGAVMDDDNIHVFHKCISSKNELPKLQKSKYVQSDIGTVYREIKKYLNEGKKVLFSGCPCQVAGLKNFLGIDYDNLIMLDLICHGTPSQKVLKKYIESSEKRLGKIKGIDFRAKDIDGKPDWNKSVTVKFDYEGGSEYQERNNSTYLKAFLHLLSINEACGKCLFAKLPRQGDITIGDYWGIEKFDESLNDAKGTSVILINNKKGNAFLRSVRGDWKKIRKTPLKVATNSNRQIVNSSLLNDKQKRFFDILDKFDFDKAVDYGLNRKFEIGYVGWWYGANYGSVLTNFALHEVLTKILVKTVLMIQYPIKNPSYDTPAMRFAKKHYEISIPRALDEFKPLNWHCEKFILGSDQLWNRYCLEDTGYHFFLNFVDRSKIKIAYATSFGHSESFFSESEKLKISGLMREFDDLSVREADGVKICRDDFHIKAELMIDPVFLCDKEIYDSVALETKSLCQKPYIFAYILDPTDDKYKALKMLSKELNMEYIVLLDGQATDKEQKRKIMGEKNVLLHVEIEQWLRLMMDADFVYTDSFHGTCFAIIYHKIFCTIKNPKRGNSRFKSLIQIIGLEDHFVEEENILKDIPLFFEKNSIDYKTVDAFIKNECNKGLNWLETAINRNEKVFSYETEIDNRFMNLEIKMTALENAIKELRLHKEIATIEETVNLTLLEKIKRKMKSLSGGKKNA